MKNLRNTLRLLGVGTLVATTNVLASPEQTAEDVALKDELAKLRSRIDQLEQKLAEQAKSPHQACDPCSKCKGGKYPILSSLNMEMYGFIWAQASHDSNPTNDRDFPGYASPKTNGVEDTSHFSASVKRTRLGLKITGPSVNDGKLFGLIEGDFWGGSSQSHGGAINPRLRHGYIQWTRDGWSVLAGQTSDLMYANFPNTLNFNTLWYSGVIGDRHAQVRIGKTIKLRECDKLLLEAGLSRPQESRGGSPHFQYNVAYSTPLCCEKDSTFSVAGVFGKEKASDSKRYRVWAVNVGTKLPFSKYLAFSGAVFAGSNLGFYRGGIGQGVNTTEHKAIRARGGWAQLCVTPNEKWEWNTGFGIDTAREGDLNNYATDAAPGTCLKRNENLYTNLKYNWNSSLWMGVELSHMRIAYKGNDRRDKNNRIELALCYKF